MSRQALVQTSRTVEKQQPTPTQLSTSELDQPVPLTARKKRAKSAGQQYYRTHFQGTCATSAQLEGAIEQKRKRWQRDRTSTEWQTYFLVGWQAAKDADQGNESEPSLTDPLHRTTEKVGHDAAEEHHKEELNAHHNVLPSSREEAYQHVAQQEQDAPSAFDLPTLSSEQLYRLELDHLPPRLAGADEQRMIEQARAGSPSARTRLLEDCIRYIVTLASKFAVAYRREFQDLVAEANLIAAEHLQAALEATCSPPAYLRTKIHFGLIDYCNTTATMITTPRDNGTTKKPRPLTVSSLDIPLNEDGDITLADTLADSHWYPDSGGADEPEPDYSALYEAIDRHLSGRQRDLVLRYYGLRGQPVQNLYEISTAWYGEKKGNGRRVRKSYAVDEAKANALSKLRGLLAPVYGKTDSPESKGEGCHSGTEPSSQKPPAHHLLPPESGVDQLLTDQQWRDDGEDGNGECPARLPILPPWPSDGAVAILASLAQQAGAVCQP